MGIPGSELDRTDPSRHAVTKRDLLVNVDFDMYVLITILKQFPYYLCRAFRLLAWDEWQLVYECASDGETLWCARNNRVWRSDN